MAIESWIGQFVDVLYNFTHYTLFRNVRETRWQLVIELFKIKVQRLIITQCKMALSGSQEVFKL